MRVVGEPGYDVPVQMRNDIAKTGEVDFIRRQQFAQALFDGMDRAHQLRSLLLGQVGHFPDMCIQDHTAEPGVIGVSRHYDARETVVPDDLSAALAAKFAGIRRHGT